MALQPENVFALRPHDRHEAMLASELALGDAGGPCLIIGDAPPAVLLGAAAGASSLTVFGTTRRVREASRLVHAMTPVAVQEARKDGDGLPDLEEAFRTVVIWDLPRRDAESCLEKSIISVADGGRVIVSTARRGGVDQRLERLTKSLCSEGVSSPSHAPAGRLCLFGRRRAPFPAEAALETPGCLPVSVIIITQGRRAHLEELLCDVLLRQNYPPLEVFVMDDSREGEPRVSEDLFGLPARSPSRTVLVPTGGVGRARAVNDALGGIEGTFVAIIDHDDRIAPNHLASLGMALERHPEWVAAAGDAVLLDEQARPANYRQTLPADQDRPMRSLLEGCPFLQSAALFRTEVVRRIEGLDPGLTHLNHYDLWFRLAEQGPIGLWPVPLVGIRRSVGTTPREQKVQVIEEAAKKLLAGFRDRVSSARLAFEFPEVPKDEREAAALAARGRALYRVDLLSEAEEDFRAALELRPNFGPGEEGLMLVLRRRGKHDLALALAEKVALRRPKDPVPHLAVANAYYLMGKRDAAIQRLDGLLGGYSELEVAHLNRIAMLMGPGDGGRGEAAIRAYLARRRGVRQLPHFDHLLVAPRQGLDEITVDEVGA